MRAPFHVLHLVHGLDVGGLEIMVQRLVARLDRARFRSTVCCFDVRGCLADDIERTGANVLLLRRKPGVDYRYPFQLANLFRRLQVDLAHLHTEDGFIYGVLAAQLARTPGVIYTEHGRDFPASPRKTLANRVLAGLNVQTVAVSTALRDKLIAYENFRLAKLTVIPNGVPDPVRPDEQRIRELRRELGADDGSVLLGTVGRLKAVKDHIGLIHAMPGLVAKHPQVRLAIVGGGNLQQALQAEIERLGMANFVILTGERKDVAPYLHAFDLFVLSSKSEGLPLSLLEGLAAAKPAVAMNVGGVADVLEEGVHGFLVEPGNFKQFVERLVWLIEHLSERQAMGERARQTYFERFTIERMVSSYAALYEEILSRAGNLATRQHVSRNGSDEVGKANGKNGHLPAGSFISTNE